MLKEFRRTTPRGLTMTTRRRSAMLACALAALAAAAPARREIAVGVSDDLPIGAADGGAAFYAAMQDAGLRENRIAVKWDPSAPGAIPQRGRDRARGRRGPGARRQRRPLALPAAAARDRRLAGRRGPVRGLDGEPSRAASRPSATSSSATSRTSTASGSRSTRPTARRSPARRTPGCSPRPTTRSRASTPRST